MLKPRASSALLLLTAGLLTLLAATACRTAAPTPRDAPVVGRVIERGVASWYGKPFHGRKTASGEVYDMHRMTAAHKELAFGTLVEVTNLDNGLRTVVEITDRGPFIRGRIIDLSLAAAREIEMVGPGIAKVELRLVETPGGGAVSRVRTAEAYGYTVQAGAFQDGSRAERLRRQLARRYADVVVRSANGWFRVHVGEYADRDRAERVQQELTRRGFVALIVPLG